MPKKKEGQFKRIINPDISVLIKCQHPTIIKFYGYSPIDFDDQQNVTVFTEHFKKGSLAEFLTKVQNGTLTEKYDNTNRQMLLIGIARGMMHLHQHQIIHQDLEPGNIYLDDYLHPYLADIMISKFYETNQIATQPQQNAAAIYTAPEILKGKSFTGKATVYSFGIIMYEIVTDSSAYPQLHNGKITAPQLIKKIMNENYRPKFNTTVKPSIQKLIEKCWSKDPRERPTFEELFKKLSYNIENVYDEQDKEPSDFNKYYLDDVDSATIAIYSNEIDRPDLTMTGELGAKFSLLNDKIENAVKPLETENAQLKQQNQEMMRKIDDLQQENEEIKSRLLVIEQRFIENDRKDLERVTINDFNAHPLSQQQVIINKIISKTEDEPINSFFAKVKNLLQFLLKFKVKKSLTYFKISKNNPQEILIEIKEEHQIRLLPVCTELLIRNNSINSSEFNSIINLFNDALIELKYPSTSFKEDYKSLIMKMKKTKEDKVKIAILISGISQTDQKFNDNGYISYVKIDSNPNELNGTFVSTIREYSFSGCSSLTKITIPSTVTEIGEGAFNDCSMLDQIEIPSSIKEIKPLTFNKCSSLTRIEIPSSITKIGDNSFKDCTSLKALKIPSSVVSIGEGAFNGCSSLFDINIPPSITELKDGVFNKCSSLTKIEIPDNVTVIGSSVFNKCSSLTTVSIPSSVTKIGRYAFSKCSALNQISIPSSVVEIGRYCFMDCESLLRISIPNSVTEIKNKTFEGCVALKHVSIPFSVTKIGDNAFLRCSSLRQISVPSSVTEIGEEAFPSSTEIIGKVMA